MSRTICQELVEWNGQLVSRCNFDYLTDGQPLIVKIGLATVLLTGALAMAYIFAKLIYKDVKYHKNYSKKYERKDVIMLIFYIFLFLAFIVPAMSLFINLVRYFIS